MNRLKDLRVERGISMAQTARELNIPYTTYVGYEKGEREPNSEMLIQLSKFYSCSVDYLIGKSDSKIDDMILDIVNEIDTDILENCKGNLLEAIAYQKKRNYHNNALQLRPSVVMGITDEPSEKRSAVKIPVLGFVRAGYPMDAVENILDYEEISEEMAHSGEFFALKIKGDSMEPKISDGDVVIVKKQSTVENGEVAVILINGNDATVKKFFKAETGVNLISTNPNYEPFFFTPKEVDSLPVEVVGRVVELRAKF